MKRISLGRINRLTVVRRADFGLYLDGMDDGDILLPTRYVPAGLDVGQEVDVFLYLDNEERLIATTEMPLAQVGDFAYLQVAWVNQFGAFLHWGPMKDLFVPFREQKMKMQKEQSYIVHLHIDEATRRIMASAKVEHYLSTEEPPYEAGQEVEVLVWQKTALGYKVIVDNAFGGLLYEDEVFVPLHTGRRMTAYIKQVRPDYKIDLTLQRTGQFGVHDFASVLRDHLREHGGICPLGDKSPAEDIYATFGVSKKVFKKAVGTLYKQRLITVSDAGLRLLSKD